jgi:uncharacterized protein YjiS (DUF1127 family)
LPNRPQAGVGDLWSKLIETIETWLERSRGRHQLAHLSARQRADVGLDAEQIEIEVRKPFWRA